MNRLIKEVAEMLGIEESIVIDVLNCYIRSLKSVISRIKFHDLESFDSIKTNAVVPGFGRFIVNYKRKIKFNKIKQKIRDGREKSKSTED